MTLNRTQSNVPWGIDPIPTPNTFAKARRLAKRVMLKATELPATIVILKPRLDGKNDPSYLEDIKDASLRRDILAVSFVLKLKVALIQKRKFDGGKEFFYRGWWVNRNGRRLLHEIKAPKKVSNISEVKP